MGIDVRALENYSPDPSSALPAILRYFEINQAKTLEGTSIFKALLAFIILEKQTSIMDFMVKYQGDIDAMYITGGRRVDLVQMRSYLANGEKEIIKDIMFLSKQLKSKLEESDVERKLSEFIKKGNQSMWPNMEGSQQQ